MTAVFVLSGTSNCGTPPIACERAHMGVDPVGECLRPARVREGEARGAEHGDEDLRHADFPGEPVNDDRDPVARVIDEQPLARRVRLPHRRRQLRFKAAIEFGRSADML